MSLKTRLNFRRFICNKPTDNFLNGAEDEVYMLIVRTTSQGGYTAYRLPSADGHWDMDEGSVLGHNCVHQIDLDYNNKANICVYIMEEDGGLPGDWASKIGDALTNSEDDTVKTIGETMQFIGGVLNKLGIKDTDDHIGSFGVEFANKNGSLTDLHWERGDDVYETEADNSGLPMHSCIIRFNGDGSDYFGEFYVDVV